MKTLPQAIKERSRVPGSCTRRKAAPSQGLFQSQVAQLGQEDRALHRPSSTLVKAEAEEGLLAPIFAWPGAPAPEASQGASRPRSSHPANPRLEGKLRVRRLNCSASSQVTPGALSAAGSA